ncbi:universal stress protein [Lewinella sp. IMCC34191]|uniref:universal stress protein n=1 Tax=Lewinella sp. IMCC34191 TaxID=2259172 RepID=UPI0013009FA6|nr:universal stress protein [Lewinella sp. IMCC34191]
MIHKVLVSIDFSKGSAAALRYAEAFSASVGIREIQVIHIFTPQTVAAGEAMSAVPVGELMDAREEALAEFLRTHPPHPDVRRRSELMLGFPADKITEESKRYDLVILGATGDSDVLESVFGSIASEVAQKSHCPVLLVPYGAHFDEYRHILYASSSLSLSRKAVLKLMDFNDLFRARIHFVHVNKEDGDNRREREKLFAPLFNNPDPEFAFEIVEVNANSVRKGLVDYLQANAVQLAVMVTEHRGFWEGLFHSSATKQMVLHPEVPVLVFHLN